MANKEENQAISTILAKRDALLQERADIRRQQSALAQRDRRIDAELADLRAAGRVFGVKVDLPPEDLRLSARFTDQSKMQADFLDERMGETLAELDRVISAAPPPAMPRVSDIILDRLKSAGAKGSKAAPIQDYIERTYGTKIHDKTVGMTLYRLSREDPPKVRREGHTWFIADEAMNPGAATPGSEDDLLG